MLYRTANRSSYIINVTETLLHQTGDLLRSRAQLKPKLLRLSIKHVIIPMTINVEYRSAPEIPQSYNELIDHARFMSAQHRTFSDKLASAISTGPIFDTDKYGLRNIRLKEALLEQFGSRQLTEFGQTLKIAVTDRKFIDLACGDPALSPIPSIVASALGAREFVGVDKNLPNTYSAADTPLLQETGVHISYEHFDILQFLARLPVQNGVTFNIAGLEWVDANDPITRDYIAASLTEIQRVTKSGDAVIIGSGTLGFDPSDGYGISLKAIATSRNR